MLESRDLTAGAAESKAQVGQAEANLRTTTSAQPFRKPWSKRRPTWMPPEQTEDAAKKLLDSRAETLPAGRAGAQAGGRSAGGLRAGPRRSCSAAQEHLRALQSVGKEEQIKTAAAQVDAARSHLQSSEAQVSYSQIVSPITGVVADRPLYAGEMATPGTPLLTVMDISQGRGARQRSAEPGRHRESRTAATITQIDTDQTRGGQSDRRQPATDPNSTTVQVWVQAENPGEQLKPGTSVHVAIMTEIIKAATVVPVAAILPGEEGGTAVPGDRLRFTSRTAAA